MKYEVGQRVKVKMKDNPLYGTVIDPNFLGIACLVETDTLVDIDSQEVMFLKDTLE
jgi:hypothetical protein